MSLVDSLEIVVGLDTSRVKRGLGEIGSITTKLAAAGATAAVGLAGVFAGLAKGAIDAGMEMETFESRLGTLMGSSTDARARMQELFGFAASTPFELGQVVNAEVTLRGFGAAADELMPKLIDFSASLGTDLAQSAIDFGKAWNQGGVGLESDTGKILKSMIEAHAGVKTAQMGIEEFREAMMETLDAKFAGGAEKLSKTMGGMMSNLNDEWSRFKLSVADAGLFNNVKGALSVTLGLISQNREGIGEIAKVVSTDLWAGLKLAAEVIAVAADGVTGLEIAMKLAAAAGSLIAQAFVGANLALTDLQIGVVRMAGGSTTSLDAMRGTIMGNGAALQQFRQEMMGSVSSLGQQQTALDQTREFFVRAENAASSFGSVLDDMAASKAPGVTTGEGDDGKASKADDALATEFESALSFSEEMAALGMSQTEREAAEYQARLDILDQHNADKLISGQLYLDTKAAIEEEHARNVAAAVDAIEEEKRKERETALREEIATETALREATVDGLRGVLDDGFGLLQAYFKDSKEIAKAAAITDIIVSGAMAVAKAFAQFGWPAGLGPAALAGVQTGLQLATVAKAHQGGPVYHRHQGGKAPDEVDIRALKTESFLNSQTTRALGEQGVNALNANGGATGPSVLELRVGRAVQREMVRAATLPGGSIERMIRDESTRTGLDTGFSGNVAPP